MMYLRIDERTDVLASLSICLKCLAAVEIEPALWKWAVISFHSALQGAMVCHLSGTAQLGALNRKSVSAWLEWHEKDRRGLIERVDAGVDEFGIPISRIARKRDRPPDDRLADAVTLFERLSDQALREEPGAGEIICVTSAQRDAFHQLHNLRNSFAHFVPKGWSIQLVGLPDIFREILDLIYAISGDPWPFRHMNSQERGRLRALLDDIRATINQMSIRSEEDV